MFSTEEIVLDPPKPSDFYTDVLTDELDAAPPYRGGRYVPPEFRAGVAAGIDMRRLVRVFNLCENTKEADLHELFAPFGSIDRVYVAIDKKTSLSRGFGYVNFSMHEEAEKAIQKLNGYEYGNLILRVEWAQIN